MAILPIVKVPEPVLRQKTKKIKKIDASIQKLIDDMIETMYDAPGVGLAATQVGVALRICVIHANDPDMRSAQDSSPGLIVLINPEIVKRSGTRLCTEGCLSLPNYRSDEVPRSEKVVVKGQNRDGRPVRYTAGGLFAEAIEHEVDHLNGILYFDYLDSIDKLTVYGPAEDGEAGEEEEVTAGH
ncbi:MAG: peptide deformylase [Dehalococcoidia bacterium]|nr:peptide deformylase [Dehalococcoidia bacterium]